MSKLFVVVADLSYISAV